VNSVIYQTQYQSVNRAALENNYAVLSAAAKLTKALQHIAMCKHVHST